MSVVARIWRGGGGFVFGIREGAVRQFPVPTAEHAVAAAPLLAAKGWNAYFSCSTFAPGAARKADQAAAIGAYWLDIDVGEKNGGPRDYATYPEAMEALSAWRKRFAVPPASVIVDSGSGLHVYWVLSRKISREEWLPTAQRLKQSLRLAGVRADPTRTEDAASILRIPGTQNLNYGEPRPVRVLRDDGPDVDPDEFAALFPAALGPQRAVGPPVVGEWAVPRDFPPSFAPVVADNCQQIRAVRDAGGAVSEPFWRAALTVLSRCQDGRAWAHEWSKGDHRYSPEEVDDKIARATGPATCQHIEQCNPAGCAGCPFAGKVTSPIQLGVQEQPPKADSPDEPWKLTAFGRFTVSDSGIAYTVPAMDGAPPEVMQLSTIPLWVKHVGEEASRDMYAGRSSMCITWQPPHSGWKEAILPSSVLAEGGRTLRAWFGTVGIWPFILGARASDMMGTAISQMSQEWLRKQGAVKEYTSLGWYPEGYVLGNELYGPKGISQIKTRTPEALFNTRQRAGTLEGWKSAVSDICKAGKQQQAVMCLGFGSPLFGAAPGRNSAVISLVGDSGAGKTTAMYTAASIFGDPKTFARSAADSMVANRTRMSASRNVMIGFDEASTVTAKQLSVLIYEAANGNGRTVGTREGGLKGGGDWAQVTFATSNRSLLEFSEAEINEANRRRVIEIDFAGAIERDPGCNADVGLFQHYGVAADVYIPALVQMRDKLPALLLEAERSIAAKYPALKDAERFTLWAASAAYVGGSIAKSLGLIDFDVQAVIRWLCDRQEVKSDGTRTEIERAPQVVADWLTHRAAQIVEWSDKGIAMQDVREPIARREKTVILIHASELQEHLRMQHISRSRFLEWLRTVGGKGKTARIAGNTPPVRAYEIPLSALEIPE